MFFNILLSTLLIICIIGVGVMIWYTRVLTQRLLQTYKNIDEFQKYLIGYVSNVETIFELTDYYGDQTIKNLIEDSKSVIEACQNFKVSVLEEEQEEQNVTKTE
jgi:predicted PurR-regulated permease PerM